MVQKSDIEKTEEVMRATAEGLSSVFGDKGFMLVVFEFGDPGISNYVANGERSDCIKALRECADRLERNQDIPPVQGHA